MFNPSVSLSDDRKALKFQVIKLIGGIALIFLLPLEYSMNDSLNDTEESLMKNIQGDRNRSAVNFFKFLIYIADHTILIVVFPFLYNFCDTRKACKVIMVVCLSMFVYSMLALLYVEPRPFWVTSELIGEVCLSGFGTPVLELMLMTILLIYTSAQFLYEKNFVLKLVVYLSCTGVIASYFVAEFYLGETYPHQCVVTIFFGLIFLSIVFSLDKYIDSIAFKCCFKYNENRKYSIYCFIATMSMFLGVVSTNRLITGTKGISVHWIKNSLSHCDLDYQVNGDSSLYVSSWVFYMQGAVFGSMFSSKRLSMHWWLTNYKLRLIRSFIAVGFSIGIYYLFYFIQFKDNTTTYLFSYAFPFIIISFTVHGLMPLIFSKFCLGLKVGPSTDEKNEGNGFYASILSNK